MNYDASSGQWVFTNDAIADFVNENDAKEMLQKEGYILLYSKPDSLPEPLRAEEINRETVKETTRVPKGRVQQQSGSQLKQPLTTSFENINCVIFGLEPVSGRKKLEKVSWNLI